jgi:hypothetical protein
LNLKATVEHNISLVGINNLANYGVINRKNEAAAAKNKSRK